MNLKFHKILVYKETLKKPCHAENLLKVLDISNATAEVAVALQFFQRMWSWMRRTVDKEQPGPLKEICTKNFFRLKEKLCYTYLKTINFSNTKSFSHPTEKIDFQHKEKVFYTYPKIITKNLQTRLNKTIFHLKKSFLYLPKKTIVQLKKFLTRAW